MMFSVQVVKMDFLVVDGVPVDLFVGLIQSGKLEATLDLVGQFDDFNINGDSVRIGL